MIQTELRETVGYLLKHKILLFMTIIAWVLTLMPFVFDGQYGCVTDRCGFIIGSNYRDGMWFLAVAATAFKTIPFQMPIFAGASLQSYHYLPNLLTYLLTYIGIPITVTYYKIIPLIFILFLTIFSVKFARKIKDDAVFVGSYLFFTFFGMHLSLITSLYHTGAIDNKALINTFQATRLLESPHTALSILMLLFVLILIYKRKALSTMRVFMLSIVLFLAFGTKFYVAFTILSILGLYELFAVIKSKNIRLFLGHISLYLLSMGLAVFIFFDPLNSTQSGSTFIFSPFSTVHHLIETPTLFPMERMVLARYFLYEHGWSPRLLAIEGFSAMLFILFYFGTRVIGIIHIVKQIWTKKIDSFELNITITILILIMAAILFIQKGDWFNPIQFAVPAAFLMNIFAARFLYDLSTRNRFMRYAMILVIILITFPANLVNIGYLSSPSRYVISSGEMEALKFLKDQPKSVIYYPIDENDMAYVSAFTGKQTYVNFINVLQNADIHYEDRLKKIEDPLKTNWDLVEVDYIYIPLINDTNQKLNAQLRLNPKMKVLLHNEKSTVYVKNNIIEQNPEEDIVACTQDVKICPDGSYVSRHPPDCAFAPCSRRSQ